MDHAAVRRHVGPVTVVLLAVGNAVLWLAARPSTENVGSYVGQFLGAEAIVLMSIGLVLISTLPAIESWFDGIDRAAIWHRRVAITGLALLLPHILLAQSGPGGGSGGKYGVIGLIGLTLLVAWAVIPRWRSVTPGFAHGSITWLRQQPGVRQFRALLGGYERWRMVHRSAGLFIALGLLHALMDGTPYDAAPVLRWSLVAVGGIGLAFYVYRELLARHLQTLHDYQVADVRQLDATLTEVALDPVGRPMRFVPGQFAMVYLETKDGWHRHPFTIASAPSDPTIRFTIKALGDYTTSLPGTLERGMPAVIGGPHGRFSHHKGTGRQAWVAGGVGITPFLSWIRALEDVPVDAVIDLFYTASGEAPYTDELREAAAAYAHLTVHVVDTARDGRLTAARVLEHCSDTPASELSVFMCGPGPLISTLQRDLRAGGVRSRHIHREHFDWR